MISLSDIVTSSGRYPERLDSEDFTPEVLKNILVLKAKVNGLLNDLSIRLVRVSSGFRPLEVNKNLETEGYKASKVSTHLIGKGLDLADADKKIKQSIVKAPHLLAKHGLWMELPEATPDWCHLDYKDRPERLIRIFRPF